MCDTISKWFLPVCPPTAPKTNFIYLNFFFFFFFKHLIPGLLLMPPGHYISCYIFDPTWRREIIFTSWLVQHLHPKLFSSMYYSGLASTFHLTPFCFALHVQSGIINFQPKRSILILRANKMRKIISEVSWRSSLHFLFMKTNWRLPVANTRFVLM